MRNYQRYLLSVGLSWYTLSFAGAAALFSTVQVSGFDLSGLTFVDGEVPTGTLDGVNTSFVLSQAPSPVDSISVHRNGIYLRTNRDYILTGRNLVFLSGAVPLPGDVLVCSYRVTLSTSKSAGDGQSAVIGQAFASPLQVTIKDGNQNPVVGAAVTFTPPNSGPGGSFTGILRSVTAITDATGAAVSPNFTANGTYGSYNVSASTGALAPVIFSMENVLSLAVGKRASQSSTYPLPSAGAAAAVDGNTDGNFYDGSVTHTNVDANAWWQVDLGGSASITSIAIWNRMDCCSSRLSDYWVFVSNTPFGASDTPATLQSRAGTWGNHQTMAPNPYTTIAVGARGQYVRVQLSGTDYLSLAEVQVLGEPY